MPILNEKQTLMRKLQACSIALNEANLYLDSHPTCPHGLAYFKHHMEEYDKYKAEYTEKFGPLSIHDAADSKKWQWVQTPFPWERGEN